MQKASQEFEVVRSWKTLRDMLRDRGCDTSDIDAISGEDVASIATSKSVFHIDLVGCNTRIIYDLNSKFKPIDVKKLLVDDIPTIILIARDAPSNAAIKGFAEMSLHVQLFLLQELQFNVSKHVLVPSHTPIRDEPDILRLVNSYHVKSRYHFPIILSSDPMARYLALMPGQLVRITRTSPNAGEYVTYRCCVKAS